MADLGSAPQQRSQELPAAEAREVPLTPTFQPGKEIEKMRLALKEELLEAMREAMQELEEKITKQFATKMDEQLECIKSLIGEQKSQTRNAGNQEKSRSRTRGRLGRRPKKPQPTVPDQDEPMEGTGETTTYDVEIKNNTMNPQRRGMRGRSRRKPTEAEIDQVIFERTEKNERAFTHVSNLRKKRRTTLPSAEEMDDLAKNNAPEFEEKADKYFRKSRKNGLFMKNL